jgi:hypothetical protein
MAVALKLKNLASKHASREEANWIASLDFASGENTRGSATGS